MMRTNRRRRSRRRPRRLADQVVVVTGGSRGIGRETAIRFARAGATVVVLARGEPALVDTVAHIVDRGGTARHIVCDVTDAAAVEAAVHQVERWFGRVDTWVGNAGSLVYATVAETTPRDLRQVLEVNVLGQLHGIHAAIPALRRAGGGTYIGVSSTEAVVTMPLHSAYAASKRAVEGLLDGLRRELRRDDPAISVTAVRPAVIDTPGYRHARTRISHRPSAPHPHYAPSVPAAAIVFAASHRVRTIHAGGGSRSFTAMQMLVPGLMDAVLSRFGRFMRTSEPALPRKGNLDAPLDDTDPRGGLPGRGRPSLYTWLRVHPIVRTALGAATTAAVLRRRRTVNSTLGPR